MKSFQPLLKSFHYLKITRFLTIFFFSVFTFQFSYAHIKNRFFESPVEGRWDLTLYNSGKSSPSWLEVRHSGLRTLVGQFVGSGGSARPISEIHFANDMLSFSIPPQWDDVSTNLVFEAKYQGDSLTGTIIDPKGTRFTFTGKRAPLLRRTKEPVWGKQIILFNGTNLDGWQATGKNQWKVDSGMLRNPSSGSNIKTDLLFNDFKLHIEFRVPEHSNSGVYLRGRYEVQILDSKKDDEPWVGGLGAIYGFISPTEPVSYGPGVWQSFDITLVGRLVTLSVNGKTVICNQEIPGITGGAINSDEGEPGPIFIQGDHGIVDFRNIYITPAL
jgi:hypothetical protein